MYELDSIYEGLYESYVNDYIIFEGILRRDFLEVNGILSENAAGDFFKGIWKRILSVLKIIKNKIKEVVDKILTVSSNIRNNFKSKKFINKYKKYYDKENGQLNNFYYEKGFIACKDSTYLLSTPTFGSIDKINNESDVKKFEKYIYSEYKNVEEYKKRMQKDLLENKESKYPFRDNKDLKTNIIELIDHRLYHYENDIKELKKKDLNEIEKTEKDVEKIINNNKENNKEEDNKKYVAYLQYLNNYKNAINISYIGSFNVWKQVIESYSKLYIAGGEYLKKLAKSKSNQDNTDSQNASHIDYDIDYINALSEATIYELDI